MFGNFFSENRDVYEIMWDNIVEPGRPQMTVWCKNFACWIPKATDTHSEYVTLIAFPLQQWLHEHAWMSRYTRTSYVVGSWNRLSNSARSRKFSRVTSELFFFSTTHCSLLRLIVRSGLDVPTFATRRLHACHHARAPSGGRWNCGREMSGNFCLNVDFHVTLRVFFYMPYSYDMGPTALFPLRRPFSA